MTYTFARPSTFGGVGRGDAQGGGIRVLKVVKGSPAARLGLEPGDVLLTINDRPLKSEAEFVAAVQSSQVEMRVCLRKVHDGRVVDTVARLDRGSLPQA